MRKRVLRDSIVGSNDSASTSNWSAQDFRTRGAVSYNYLMEPQMILLLSAAAGLAIFIGLMKYSRPSQAPSDDNRRTVNRFKIAGKVILQWCEGADAFLQIESGKAIELNRFGGSVLLSRPVPIGSRVYFESRVTWLVGFGEVKRCTMTRQGYSIGVEFRGALLRMLKSDKPAYLSPMMNDGKVVAYTLTNAVVCSEHGA